MDTGERPSKVRLRAGNLEETDFDTRPQRAVAKAILRFWEQYHTFTGVAEASGWSESQVRKVFYGYFEPDDDGDSGMSSGIPDDPAEAYAAGYRTGYRDGFDDASDENGS